MAKATKNIVSKMVPKVTMVKENTVTYTLELEEQEVRTLVALFSRVGGSPIQSPRGWINKISQALSDAGAPHYNDVKETILINQGISFLAYPMFDDRPGNLNLD